MLTTITVSQETLRALNTMKYAFGYETLDEVIQKLIEIKKEETKWHTPIP